MSMDVLSSAAGVKIRRPPRQASTVLRQAIAPKVVRTLDTQEHHPLISLNMVVCLNNQDLNQPDRWLINSLQASMLVSKVVMVARQPSPQRTEISKWDMEALLVLVAMVVVLSKLLLLNGAPLPPKALTMALVAIRASLHTIFFVPYRERDPTVLALSIS